MPHDRYGDPWSGVTYNGFSGTGPASPRPEPRQFEPHEYEHRRPLPRPRGISRRMLAGGVAVAATLGLLFGVLAKPDFGGVDRAPMRAAAPAAQPPPVAATMPIEVAAAPAVEAPAPRTAPLEVLPPDLARAAAEPVPAPPRALVVPRPVEVAEAPPPPVIRAAPPPELAREAPAVAASAREPLPVAQDAPPPRMTLARERPGFNCRYARTRSEQMVCGDDQLARLDRQLNRAFQRAVQSGVPFDELRADQDDWLSIREDAARHSPDAVRNIYRQRIRELQDMAG